MKNYMKNNIRYKGNTNNTSVIIFVIGSQLNKNSQRWCFLLGRSSRDVFFVVVHSFLFFMLLSFLFFILLLLFFISFPGCFAMLLALHP